MRALLDILLCVGVAWLAFVALCIRATLQLVRGLVRPLMERATKGRPRPAE